MNSPARIQLSRRKGWKMPPNTVKVDRGTRWGNDFKVTEDRSAEQAVTMFERELQVSAERRPANLAPWLAPLRGKNLACWCALDAPCHADVLLKLANAPVCEEVEPR